MISIITSVHNNVDYIEEALNSFMESCGEVEFEILVGVDNCKKSMDNLFNKFPTLNKKIKIYYFTEKVGTYVIRNTLASKAKFDDLILFDSDDVMRKQVVSNVKEYLKEYDFVRFGFIPFNGNLKYSKEGPLGIKFSHHFGAFGIKKSVFLEMNGFEPWVCAADGEFNWRIAANNRKIKLSNDIDILYRRHENNLTSGSQTGMNSELRKKYHKQKQYKIDNSLKQPLSKLNSSEDYVIITDEILKKYKNNSNDFYNTKTSYELSIIIPTYRNLSFIQECLDSITKSAKNLNCEILVGIDSCKETLDYVKKNKFDSRIEFFYFPINSGPYVIKNSLSNFAKSEYLLFFDSDDVMKDEMIYTIYSKMNQFDFIKPMYSDFYDGKNKNNSNVTKTFGEGVFCIKKKLFLEMNGFEPWRCAADSDFMSRLYKNNKKCYLTESVLFHRRIHTNSLTQNSETSAFSKLRAHYFKLSKSKTSFESLPKLVTEKFDLVFSEKNPISKLPNLEVNESKKESILNRVMFPMKSKEEKNVDYEKINQVVQQKGVYTPQKNIPIRENKPNDRNELIKLKNGQNNQQLEKLFKGKPNRRNGLPNIF